MRPVCSIRSGALLAILCLASTCTAAESAPATKSFSAKDREYWAFQPIRRSEPPKVRNTSGFAIRSTRSSSRNFEEKGIQPGPEADKITLIRRVTFDLTGLPPTPREVDTFLADRSPRAYERVVDRLLASPRMANAGRAIGST